MLVIVLNNILLWYVNRILVTVFYFIYMNIFEVLFKFKLMYYLFVKIRYRNEFWFKGIFI